jgi:hypothetical protein
MNTQSYWQNHFKQLSSKSSFGATVPNPQQQAQGTIDTTAYSHPDINIAKSKPVNQPPADPGILSTIWNVESLPATWTTETLPNILPDMQGGGAPSLPSLLPKHFWWYVAGFGVLGLLILPNILGAATGVAAKASPFGFLMR